MGRALENIIATILGIAMVGGGAYFIKSDLEKYERRKTAVVKEKGVFLPWVVHDEGINFYHIKIPETSKRKYWSLKKTAYYAKEIYPEIKVNYRYLRDLSRWNRHIIIRGKDGRKYFKRGSVVRVLRKQK